MKDGREENIIQRIVRRFPSVSIFSFLCFFSLFFSSNVLRPTSYVFAQSASPSHVCFQNKCITVEVADNEAARIRGLQGRFSLDPQGGMLFVFPQENIYNFWMKDTFIPLDMIWLDSNKRVVDIKANVQPCQENPCPMVSPNGTAQYVLEINAGAAESFGIRVGDTAVLN